MKPRILLAENNTIDHFIICKMLKQLGCHVDRVENGFLAVDAIRQTTYDMVFVSRDLPLLDGLETITLIRELPQGQDLPIVVFLEENHVEDIFACLNVGASDFITRPIAGVKFIAILNNWLGRFGPVTPAQNLAATG